MRVVTELAEEALVEAVYRLRSTPTAWCVLHFHLSGLQEESLSNPRMALTISALTDIMTYSDHAPNPDEAIFVCHDRDIFVLCHQHSKEMLEKIIKGVGFFYADDPLISGAENEVSADALCTIYDMAERFEKLFHVCTHKQYLASELKKNNASVRATGDTGSFNFALKRRESRTTPVIMIVDDDKFTLALLSKTINSKYEIYTAANGAEGLKLYQSEAPDIVFLDIEMPDISGHKLLGSIIALDPDAFVIMLSAHNQMDNVKKAVANGAKGFVAKPFSKTKIESYIHIAQVEREERRRSSHGPVTEMKRKRNDS
jgi:CheY-like chemotaxis protein